MTRQTDRSETPCKHGEIATYPGRGVQCQKCGRWAAFASRPEREEAGLRAAVTALLTVAFQGDDFLTQNGIPMTATPGVRRALRTVRAALGTVPSCADCGGDHPSGHPWHTPPDAALGAGLDR